MCQHVAEQWLCDACAPCISAPQASASAKLGNSKANHAALPRYFNLKPEASCLQPASHNEKMVRCRARHHTGNVGVHGRFKTSDGTLTMVNEDVRLIVAGGILWVEAPDDHGVHHAAMLCSQNYSTDTQRCIM